jgi:branched-chain amino acid transport system permease protein
MTSALTEARVRGAAPPARRSRRTVLWVELAATVLLLLLPGLIGSAYHLRLLEDVAILAVMALGMTLIFGYTGQISLGQAAFYAIGGYTCAILQDRWDLPAPLAWVTAVALGALMALVVSFPLLRIHGHFLALGTLALGLLVQTLLVQLVPLTGGHDGMLLPASTSLGPWLQGRFPYVEVAVLVLAYWLVRNLTAGSVGRALLALRDDPVGAASLGIPVTRYKTLAFMTGGALAAAAGVLYAQHTQVITPGVFGFDTSIQVLLVVVIGGMSNRIGALIGAFVVVIMPEMLHSLQSVRNLVFALLLLAVLLFLPGGVTGGLTSARHALARRWRRTRGEGTS